MPDRRAARSLPPMARMPRPGMNRTRVAMIGWMRRRVMSQPLNQPSAAATRTGTTNASAMPMAGWGRGKSLPRKISGASAPAMAMSAPTERSMPPVAMTRVMPTATITMAQTWVRLTLRVCQVAKLGVMARLTRMSRASAIQAPWRVRKLLMSKRDAPRAGGSVAAVLAMAGLLVTVSHGGHDALLVHGIAFKLGDRAPVAQHEDAARGPPHPLQLGGDHHHAEPLSG